MKNKDAELPMDLLSHVLLQNSKRIVKRFDWLVMQMKAAKLIGV